MKRILKKIIFQNRYVALETPPPFMANTILNFHFDYLHPFLRLCLKKFVGYIRNRRQKVGAAEAAGSGGSSWGSKSRVVHNATGSFNWQTGATRHQHHHHFQQQHHHHCQQYEHRIQQHHHQHHQHYHHNRHQTTSIILIFVCLVNSKPNEKKNLQSSNY